VRDRGPGAAGAQQHHAIARSAEQPAGEALGEAGRVRVVADRSAVARDDGVDGLELLGLGRERVEVVDHLALARVRDVQAAPALVAGGLEQVPRLGAELLDVEQPVLVLEALARRLALVQRGAQRRPDPGADQSYDVGPVPSHSAPYASPAAHRSRSPLTAADRRPFAGSH
jgi:hypothetical protein